MVAVGSVVTVVLGLAGLVFASDVAVERSRRIARRLGVTELIIGLVVVSIGTSLPELSISVGALGRGAKGLSLGNLIGSNITDPLLSLGLAVARYSLDVAALGFDFAFWIFATLVALLLLWNHVDLNRKESSVLTLVFAMHVFLRATGM